jgi:hypothetical protein
VVCALSRLSPEGEEWDILGDIWNINHASSVAAAKNRFFRKLIYCGK